MKTLVEIFSESVECWKIIDLPVVPRVGDTFCPAVEVGHDGVCTITKVSVYELGFVCIECKIDDTESPFVEQYGWNDGPWIEHCSEEEMSQLMR